jgi:hypothetical protein
VAAADHAVVEGRRMHREGIHHRDTEAQRRENAKFKLAKSKCGGERGGRVQVLI